MSLFPPKPPKVSKLQLRLIQERVHKRWLDEHKPKIDLFWFEEVYIMLHKMGHVKETIDGEEKE